MIFPNNCHFCPTKFAIPKQGAFSTLQSSMANKVMIGARDSIIENTEYTAHKSIYFHYLAQEKTCPKYVNS